MFREQIKKIKEYLLNLKLQKRSHILIGVILVIVISALLIITHRQSAAFSGGFIFTTAGDHGFNADSANSMDKVANSNSSFYLAMGDLSYQEGAEQRWCNAFKSKFNDIEILAGNHDTGEDAGGDINKYIEYCPFTLSSLTGTYGKQYYFDYPQTGKTLARFIMIAPGLRTLPYDYNVGGDGYTFTENAINEARNKKIPWIIVGMHKNCISVGHKTCEVGTDIMDLVLAKKVDLIIQSHDHNYQRSHQLRCIKVNSVDQNCITDNGADGLYPKGKGSVIIINGEFGQSHYETNISDTEAGYFAALDSTTFGISKYRVTETQLSAEYLKSGRGSFADSFSIR